MGSRDWLTPYAKAAFWTFSDCLSYACQDESMANHGATGGRFRGVNVAYLQGRFQQDFACVLEHKADAKVYDIEPRIRELTADTVCPRPCLGKRRNGCAFVDWLGDTHAGRSTIMLSYGWGYEVRVINSALQNYCDDNNLDPSSTFIWICCLCINQHRVKEAAAAEENVAFDDFRREFSDRVRGIGHVVALLSPWNDPLYLSRVWCVFEFFEAIVSPGVKLDLVLSKSDSLDLKVAVDTAQGDMKGVWHTLSSLDIGKAQASVEADRCNILRLVEEGPGLSRVNGEATQKIGAWFRNECEMILTERESVAGVDHPETLRAADNLATLIQAQGKFEDAKPLFERALTGRRNALGDSHPDTLMSTDNLANVLHQIGRWNEAERLYREALAGREVVLGPTDEQTLWSYNNLAILLQDQGNLEESEKLYRIAFIGMETLLGDKHEATLQVASNFATLLHQQGESLEAETLLRRSVVGRTALLGPMHPDTVWSQNNLAVLLMAMDKIEEAETLLRKVIACREAVLGPRHNDTFTAMHDLGHLLECKEEYEEAERWCRASCEGRTEIFGKHHRDTLISMNDLACLLEKLGRIHDAEAMFWETLEFRENWLGSDHEDTLISYSNLSSLLEANHKPDLAIKLSHHAFEGYKKTLGLEHVDTRREGKHLASNLEKAGRYDEAYDVRMLLLEFDSDEETVAASELSISNRSGAVIQP